MSHKIKKPRAQRKQKNEEIMEFYLGLARKGGPMKSRQDKRGRKDREWKEEIRDHK